jgi:hypothetical protein
MFTQLTADNPGNSATERELTLVLAGDTILDDFRFITERVAKDHQAPG